MQPSGLAFLTRLLETPSPSGFEQAIQTVIREEVTGFADQVRTDTHGNVSATRHATMADAPRILLAGHCDQIGLMVQHIDAEGFLYIQPIGGWDIQVLIGQSLSVWTQTGPVPGLVSRKAIHLLTAEERKKVPEFTDVWVDLGAKSREDAELIVRIGDPITLTLGLTTLRNGLVSAAALDDKVGVWVVMEALRLLKDRTLNASVTSVSTVAEEIGLRGATTATYTVNPHIGIAVDVCHATDTPNSDKKQLGEVKCGGGPVVFRGPNMNPRVVARLEAVAASHGIPIQLRGAPRASANDANVMQISRAGVAVGSIGIPNRYMHSPVEVVHLDDLENAAKLIAEFCASVDGEQSWIP